MRIALISDIHGNLEAFRAVLADIDKQNIDKIYNLGDFIDYGADSEEIARYIMNSEIESIIGNHEYPFIKPSEANQFTNKAYRSFQITKENLSEDIIAWIKDLPKVKIYKNIRFVHGMPPDSVDIYLTYQSKYELMNRFREMEEEIAFIGHTHIQKIVKFHKKNMNITVSGFSTKPVKLDKKHKYIVNVGSIGQPRSSNKRAKYVIYDLESHTLHNRQLDYDAEKAAEKIRKAGYPDSNASILLT